MANKRAIDVGEALASFNKPLAVHTIERQLTAEEGSVTADFHGTHHLFQRDDRFDDSFDDSFGAGVTRSTQIQRTRVSRKNPPRSVQPAKSLNIRPPAVAAREQPTDVVRSLILQRTPVKHTTVDHHDSDDDDDDEDNFVLSPVKMTPSSRHSTPLSSPFAASPLSSPFAASPPPPSPLSFSAPPLPSPNQPREDPVQTQNRLYQLQKTIPANRRRIQELVQEIRGADDEASRIIKETDALVQQMRKKVAEDKLPKSQEQPVPQHKELSSMSTPATYLTVICLVLLTLITLMLALSRLLVPQYSPTIKPV